MRVPNVWTSAAGAFLIISQSARPGARALMRATLSSHRRLQQSRAFHGSHRRRRAYHGSETGHTSGTVAKRARTGLLSSDTGAVHAGLEESPIVEILDVLFPRARGGVESGETEDGGVACYADRVAAGRQAQGYLTSDGLAARALAPPTELTYGEYDVCFFLNLVEMCLTFRAGGGGSGRHGLQSQASKLVFGDLGSGCGRLVLAQALAWPWRSCRGIEMVESLHHMGQAALLAAERMEKGHAVSSEASDLMKNMAPCTFSLGDVNDEVQISDIDVLFCYSSSFPAYGDVLTELSYTLGHKLRRGAQVITTDRRLVSDGPWEFALLAQKEGPNLETGGRSTAFLWEVVKSAL